MAAIARSLPVRRKIDDEAVAFLLSLRRLLGGQWGLVFSHADDFAAYGFEVDRWLAHVRDAFDATEIRPIALTGNQDGANAWIPQVGGLTVPATLHEIRRSILGYEEIMGARSSLDVGPRYVLLVDEACRLRWSFQYDTGASLPSPIQLAALAEAKRREHKKSSLMLRVVSAKNR